MHEGFTKRKFLALPTTQQHKKCAERLRHAFDSDNPSSFDLYNEMQAWMGLQPLKHPSDLPDRYHTHLKHAHIELKEHNLLPNIRTGDKTHSQPSWPIAIFLDNIRSAHNIGSILRTTEAFALGSVHFSPQTPFTDNKKVRDASMSAHQWVPCHPNTAIESLPKPLIALETSPKATPVFDFLYPDSFSLAIGNEEYGCSPHTLQASDFLIEIPLRGRKNSLNVANAFAITAAVIANQRRLLDKR